MKQLERVGPLALLLAATAGAAIDPNSTPALMQAVLHQTPGAVRVLLKAGADPNEANAAGATALMWRSTILRR